MFSDNDNDHPDEKMNGEPSTSNVQMEGVQEVCNDFDEDNDDFGDFEVASASNAEIGNVQSPTNNNVRHDLQNFDKALLPNLPEILEQLNLQSNENSTAGCDSEGTNDFVCDLFHEFDVCDSNFIPGNQIVNSRSLGLWSRLCNVEETNALNFLWNNSLTYINFLNALRINVNKNNKRLGTQMAHSTESSSVSQSASCSGDSATVVNSVELIDSLFVPPASFDWQTSGLSNPLTGSSMPTVQSVQAVLACEYFNGESSVGSHCNGESILKHELALDDENSQNPQRHLVDIQELLEKNSLSGSSQTSPLGTKTTEQTGDFFNKSKQDANSDDNNTLNNHSKAALPDHYNLVIGSRLASSARVAEK